MQLTRARALRAEACRHTRLARCLTVRASAAADRDQRGGGAWTQITAAACAGLVLASPAAALAVGLESIDGFGSLPSMPSMASISEAQRSKLAAAEDTFQQSDTLKKLLEKSEQNKAKNKKDIQNKYCYRQAELGIGDCGGLNMIPGMTKNGKQKTPEWLQKALGVEVPDAGDLTLDELMKRDFTKQQIEEAAAAAAQQ